MPRIAATEMTRFWRNCSYNSPCSFKRKHRILCL